MTITEGEFHPYAKPYINKVIDLNPLEVLSHTQLEFYEGLPISKLNYSYGPDKWTIAQVLGHIIDTERIFSYRALRIGRGDTTPLAGFEQDDYIVTALSGERSWMSLLDEYIAVRQSTVTLLQSMSHNDLVRLGTASDHPFSCRAFFYMMAGHELHHIDILKERYL